MTSPAGRAPRRLPMLFQSEAAECGLACLAMAASYHGHELDLSAIRHRFRVSLKGTTLKDLTVFARRLGMTTRALRLEPAGLSKLALPAILHFDMNHFVVLKAVKGGRIVIHDPARGVCTLSPRQVSARFTGIAMELIPAAGFERRRERSELSFVQLVGAVPGSGGALAKALVLSAGLQILILAAPLYVQLALDRGVSQGDASVLLSLALGFALFAVLRGVVGWLRAKVLLAFGGLVNAAMVSNLVGHMLRLPHAWFESRHVSSLLSRIASVQPLKELITNGLVGVVVDGLMAVLTLLAAMLFAPALALVVLAAFVVISVLKIWEVRAAYHREQEYIEAFAKAQAEFIETVRAIASVKLFRKQDERETVWRNRHIESVNRQYEAEAAKAVAGVMRDVTLALCFVLVVFLGARQVVAGQMTLGVMIAFITYQQLFMDSAGKLLDFAGRYKMLDIHLQRLADVALAEPENEDAGVGEPRVLAGRVTVENLAFRYGELEDLVLKDISLDIKPGEFVAITGRSGGGKTTLLKLIVGLLEPTSGRILYDGVPMERFGLSAIRDQIGVVMQDDVLLSGSIAQNITFFDAAPDFEKMAECARLAAVHDDISKLPMGFETMVGDMGSALSGGQRQRVLLARALYRSPKILFMDEGTSSLDTENEREVNRNLKALAMTRIIIAHRAETIQAADRILELTEKVLTD